MSNANNPVTEVIAFMIEYDWRVCLISIPQYSFTIQKPVSELLTEPFPETGLGVGSLFQQIEAKVLPNSTIVAHPRFLAYVLGPPNGIAPFAEAIAAALNQNCNFWQLSPAASVIERKVVHWLGSLFDYPETAGGILTSGGSMATLMALATALHCKAPVDIRRVGLSALDSPLVVYSSEEAHRCVEKGAAILGIGLDNVRKIPVDSDFRMRVDALETAIAQDRIARTKRVLFALLPRRGRSTQAPLIRLTIWL